MTSVKTWPCKHIVWINGIRQWWFYDGGGSSVVSPSWGQCPIRGCGALRPTKRNIALSIMANPDGKRGKREGLESEFPS